MSAQRSLFLQALAGETTSRPPVWFMRQAGRYLPEYRALRAQAPDFIAFCMNPEMATEATLQPMRRFNFDASIVFADILLIPRALGQSVWFETGEGPRLGELPSLEAMREAAPSAGKALSAVGETLSRVRAALEPERALIGFCGAPWTVLTYMLDGQRAGDRATVRQRAYEEPGRIAALLEVLAEASAHYLAMQVAAGAEALMIFESWAEGLPDQLFETLVIGPHRRLLARLRDLGVDAPVIGFPRGAPAMAERYAEAVSTRGIGLDTSCPMEVGRRIQRMGRTVQGALDPLLLRAGGVALDARVTELLDAWRRGPRIFNLGHGILPDTPIAHVEQVLQRVTGS